MIEPITCPWCGTSYAAFRSNCKNCGGPLPPPRQVRPGFGFEAPETVVETPPPPPRHIADSYALRLMGADGWAIAAFVFLMLGLTFFCTGVPMTAAIATAMVGIPFALLGLAFLGAAAAVFAWRFQRARKVVRVLREGEAATGQIISNEPNPNVTVNGRNPWVIQYGFRVNGRDYTGQVTTLNWPGPGLQPGRQASVLYLPADPALNALYPHP
jgi:membrane protein implicated in regulation of membrane protease activity